MLFEISTASVWKCHVTKEDFYNEPFEGAKERYLERFEEEIKSIKQYTSLPILLNEIGYITRYTDGREEEVETIIRPTIEISDMNQLVNLSKECSIIVDYDSYTVPSIKFYDSYIE